MFAVFAAFVVPAELVVPAEPAELAELVSTCTFVDYRCLFV